MNDRELLELAAKAAGIVGGWVEFYGSGDYYYRGNTEGVFYFAENGDGLVWNPLTDDGDALRLAVKLGFIVEPGKCWHSSYGPAFGEDVLDGVMAATRRAIVRAASEIGKAMQ